MAEIRTTRLVLRRWRDSDRGPFAAMNADRAVMEYLPSALTRQASDAFVDRIEAEFDARGFGLYAVETGGDFIGFIGLSALPLTDQVEVGWRLARHAWGHGYATEGAVAVLEHGFRKLGLTDVVSITSVLNVRSQRVMQRIGLTHDPADDFDHPSFPAGHPLRPHVMYRASAATWEPPT